MVEGQRPDVCNMDSEQGEPASIRLSEQLVCVSVCLCGCIYVCFEGKGLFEG